MALIKLPHMIAICGNPGSGKSTVQNILRDRYFVLPVDDAYCLRHFAMTELGLTWEDVSTQEGKKRKTVILGKEWENREILGQLGNKLEEMFGDHILPWIATRGLDKNFSYSFGSVRRDQARFYKANGGIVIGIRNPTVDGVKYEFDNFDPLLVDAWINNDGIDRGLSKEEALKDLETKVVEVIQNYIIKSEEAV